MHDSVRVHRRQRQAELPHQVGRLPAIESASVGDAILQAAPLDVGHHHMGHTVVLADIIDGADVGMADGRGRAGFAQEALLGGGARDLGRGPSKRGTLTATRRWRCGSCAL